MSIFDSWFGVAALNSFLHIFLCFFFFCYLVASTDKKKIEPHRGVDAELKGRFAAGFPHKIICPTFKIPSIGLPGRKHGGGFRRRAGYGAVRHNNLHTFAKQSEREVRIFAVVIDFKIGIRKNLVCSIINRR
jgi:hypothetical protein